MDETRFLKLISSLKKEKTEVSHHTDPLFRFKRVVLNLTESALASLNRISAQEMGKGSPSASLMEEYYLLHHYLDFIRRLCRGKSD